MVAETDIPFAALIEPIARKLLGEPNRAMSSKTELRYGSHGSMSVDLKKGTWFDHETGAGGGALDLIGRQTGLREGDRLEWLEQNTNWQPDHDRGGKPNGRANGGAKGEIAKVYPYVDEDGRTLFEVVRFEPKAFRQRAPNGDWSVKGIKQVPYRLPDLIEAIATDVMVFVVEGEKDADNLQRLGVPATTNAMGAGKWRSELNQYFAGADVVVIPDNDPQKKNSKTGEPMSHEDGRPILPGQDHAHEVARQLTPVARRVRYLDLSRHWPAMPPKADVTNWLCEAGGTADRLYALAQDAPDWTPELQHQAKPAIVRLVMIDIVRWDGMPIPERRWVVRNRIPDRNVTLFTGEGGVGKTLVMMQCAVATVIGRDWIGELPEPGPVMFLTAEDDEDELHFRMDKIVRHYDTSFRELADLHLMSLAGKDAVLAGVGHDGIVKPTPLFEALANSAREIMPRWIGIDTAADVFIVDERNRSQVRQCISLLRGLALSVGTAVVLLSHPSLTGISSGTGLSGSTAWNNSVRSRLYLKSPKKSDSDEDGDHGDVRVLEVMKANYGPIGEPVRLVWKDGLLLNEPGPTSMERIALDANAQNVFLAILDRYNKQDLTASANPSARNFAPKVFADLPEAKALHPQDRARKRLLREAMENLLSKDRIYVGKGPKGISPSKQSPCLYAAGTLL
jgi:RecA-family ATPase